MLQSINKGIFLGSQKPQFEFSVPKVPKSPEELSMIRLNDMFKKQLVKIQRFNRHKNNVTNFQENFDNVPESTEFDYQDISSNTQVVEDPIDSNEGQVIEQGGLDHSKFLEVPLKGLKNKTIKLANKFLSLFTIIQFSNSRCQATSSSSDYEGFCFHRVECFKRNGTAIGFCANGYGVCCVGEY